ncbi:MAG: hypothetical protein A2Y74_04455 [Actinobacteria bacterium RBG_13_63_9]|nr:MAG: hypothetical protein A2Y74_04455 [Actinobacteria bacterium RBG_13_63_9]
MDTRLLPMERIHNNAGQPRKDFDDDALEELAASIAAVGLQQPIKVRPLNGGFEVVMGERRWRACKMLGWDEIPAIVEELGDEEAAVLALVENIQRRALNVIEEAEAYRGLRDMGLTVDEIAAQLGVRAVFVSWKLDILERCRPDVVALVKTGGLTMLMGYRLSKISHNGQAQALRQMVSRPMTRQEIIGMLAAIEGQENQLEAFPLAEVVEPETRLRGKRQLAEAMEKAAVVLNWADGDVEEMAAAARWPNLEANLERVRLTIRALNRLLSAMERVKGGAHGHLSAVG